MQVKKSLIPLALGGLGIGTTEFVMMGVLPDISKGFGITIPEAGHVISAYAMGVVVGAPLLTVAASNIAPKKILFWLMAMFTVFNTLSAFAPSPVVLLLARFFSGLPHGAFFGVGSVVASRLADKGKQAQAISVMFAGLTIANLLTVPIGTYIGHHYSWRYTFGSVGLIGAVTMASLYVLLPALPVSRSGDFKSELKVFARVEPWLIVLITSIGTGGLFCWISYIAPLMTEVTHLDVSTVPYVMVIAGFGMVVGNVAGGKLADKLNPLTACIVLLIAMAVGLLAIYFLSWQPALSLILTFVAGSLSIALAAPIQVLMIKTTQGAEMLGASITQAAFNIGNALGAFLGGLPIEMGYGYTSPELVGAAMAVVGAGFAWLLIIRNRKADITKVEAASQLQVS
ncbi:MFS transporter [Mucilaginibacter pallidiroseus]|uniref:MFS transporter n=1 Tax=Mucilaginibacter pallidiroseus TaxID=2599295 RepID=A0A563UEK8_9SPHI|nr:MFS transporter [Mucilaginibacter pallidiroseus]TWR29790.1 MFS transporter [Mucilaginibacter pallidiroseus]